MKMIRATLKLALVLYICTALSGVYVLSASAKITPHAGDEDTTLITIEKGDTLWHLCQEHLKDPLRWRELSKYNDFTNPHLIYPGEALRIPVAMVKEIVQAEEEDIVMQQEELEKLQAELAESEATREKLIAEIEGLNEKMAELKGELKELEEGLKSQEALMEAVNESADELGSHVKEALEAKKSAVMEQLAHLDEHIEALGEMLEERKMSAAATHKLIEEIQGNVAMSLEQIEMSQKGVAEMKMMLQDAKGVHEEMSSNKRTLVFLTTAVAGIGWLAINLIGGRSGD